MANKKDTAPETANDQTDLLTVLKSMSEGIANLSDQVRDVQEGQKELDIRLGVVERGGKNDFRNEARQEDIDAAAEHRKGINTKIVSIVDETLGTDFGIELTPLDGDRIGYMFTLLVPELMNDTPVEKRPLRDGVTGEYQKDGLGNVLTEDYRRPDRRSRIVSSNDSYSAIREHCEKVRAYMTAFYAAKHQPMPELRVK